ncbi:MAG: hypothetical protein ACE5OZ_10685 [Candidatus Heimdallarchaeota archaeon]
MSEEKTGLKQVITLISQKNFNILPLPLHPPPRDETTVSEWLATLSDANLLDFLVLYDSVIDLMALHAASGGKILAALTLAPKKTILGLDNDLKFELTADSSKKPHRCPFKICEKSYQYRSGLRYHLAQAHDGIVQESVVCKPCKEKFTGYQAYSQHYRAEHQEWRCPRCNIVFREFQAYQQHLPEERKQAVFDATRALIPFYILNFIVNANPSSAKSFYWFILLHFLFR